jgi:hypothetical protein
MQLISVENSKNGWKIQYESKATDGIPVKIKYPSLSDIGLGKPTRDFYQAVAKFLPMAIAIAHLDKEFWHEKGKVTAIRFKEGKDEEMIQIAVMAESDESFAHPTITTHWVEHSSLRSMLATDQFAPALTTSISNLEAEVGKYIEGDRYAEQQELELAIA